MKISVIGERCTIVDGQVFVAGAKKVYPVEFIFDNSWDGYTATAVFESAGSEPVSQLLVDGKCIVPWEVLIPNVRFRVGVFGVRDNIERPTIWTHYLPVADGTEDAPEAQPDPTPGMYTQMLQLLNKHEQAEAIRVINEEARKDAEDVRQDAEAKRAAAESQRVANDTRRELVWETQVLAAGKHADEAEASAKRAEQAVAAAQERAAATEDLVRDAEASADKVTSLIDSAYNAAARASEAEAAAAQSKADADASKQAAQSAQSGAEAAHSAAESAASSASTSARQASASEQNAAGSASAAANSAYSASSSEINAMDAASNALTQANNAKKYATASAKSATDAQSAMTAAKTAQSGAEAAHSAAESAASSASTSARQASVSEQNAARSASAAAQSASSIGEAERIVTEKASEASSSAANAAASAEAAEKSAEKAANIAGGSFATKPEAQGYADTAESNAKSYTDQQISSIPTPDVSGQIGEHNTNTESHNDIRELIIGLTNRLNTLADSDDTTLDQFSEVVAYIKNNKSLIDGITTSKVNVADIINNLTTNVSNKPLSAAQGVVLKALIDAITVPTKVSELENDSGYLTRYTETDPTVPAWAKASTKPTYTASEVGAAKSSHNHDSRYYTESEMNTKLAGKSDTNHNHAGMSISPSSIELNPGTSAGHGGYIDFHFNSDAADYTSRIQETVKGVLKYNGNGIISTANITALYNVSVKFTNGIATYSNSAIKSSSIIFVQWRAGSASTLTDSVLATTSESGKVTIVEKAGHSVALPLNIVIINL